MFSIGVAGFGLVSLLCAVAPSIEVLVACRALQGAFGALLTPSALAVIVAAFPKNERGAAIGSWTAWAGIATVVGPLAGGFLVDAVSWRLIFAVNIPFVVATLVLVQLAVAPRERGTARARVDWFGAALTFLGLAGPVLALIREPAVGWSSPEVWGPGLGGPALLAVFLAHERRTPAPMLPLGLFSRRNFAIGNVQTFAMYGGLGVTFFLLVLFLQEVAGYSALRAGFALMPSTIVMFVLSKRMGRLADRFGPRLFMGLGPLTAAVGLALMLRLHAHLNYFTDLFPALLIFSIGLASTVAPLTAAVLSDADESNAGIASGVNNAIARVAGLLAIAAVGAVITAQFSSITGSGSDWRQALPGAAKRRCPSPTADARARRSIARRPAGFARRSICVGSRLPSRDRHLSDARRARRSPRPSRDSQPATGRALRGMRRRPARRPALGRRAPAAADTAATTDHPRDGRNGSHVTQASGGERLASNRVLQWNRKRSDLMSTAPPLRQTEGARERDPLPGWTFEPGHTEAGFRARHMMVTWVHGLFKDIHGELHLDLDNPLSATFSGKIDATKLWTGEPDRDAHLRSADFFDVEHHPEITFIGALTERTGDTNTRPRQI